MNPLKSPSYLGEKLYKMVKASENNYIGHIIIEKREIMTGNLKQAYLDLGKILFDSGIANLFGIDPEQKIDFNNMNVILLIEAIKLPGRRENEGQ